MIIRIISYGVPYFLAVLFATLWVISERKGEAQDRELRHDAQRIAYLEQRAHWFNSLLDRITASPVQCKICGKFMRGRWGLSIVHQQAGTPRWDVAHVHPACAPHLVPDEEIVVHVSGSKSLDSAAGDVGRSFVIDRQTSVDDSIKKVQQSPMAKARQCGMSNLSKLSLT